VTTVLPSSSNVVTAFANGAMLASETVLANGAARGPGERAGWLLQKPGREGRAQLQRWKPHCRWLLTVRKGIKLWTLISLDPD
jgi:hypothetical protein